MIPSEENKPHVLFYGWAFTQEWLWKYAHEHKLKVDLSPRNCTNARERKEKTLDYGKLDPALRGKDLPDDRQLCARYFVEGAVQQDLEKRCGVFLTPGQPVCDPKKYIGVFALYTNYTVVESYRHWDLVGTDLDAVVEKMDEAMVECDQETELMWWYDINSLSVSAECIAADLAR